VSGERAKATKSPGVTAGQFVLFTVPSSRRCRDIPKQNSKEGRADDFGHPIFALKRPKETKRTVDLFTKKNY
jgi:hypothetical protein